MGEVIKYVEHLPLFFLMVFLGVAVNLTTRTKSVTTKRILKEIVSAIWISIIVGSGLEYFTEWSVLLISSLSSVAGYFNSKIITFVGNDLLLALGNTLVEKIKGYKSKDSKEDLYE